MEYLERLLGIRVAYDNETPGSLPNFILARYRIQKVTLDGTNACFVYPRGEMDPVDAVKKHMDRIKTALGAPAILVPEHLTYREKAYLLRDHIPFIVEGKQIYLPFLAVYLQERGDGEAQAPDIMLPSAQLLLLYYIYHGCGELMTSEAAVQLGLTATSLSRASRQLEQMGIIASEKRGVQKIICSARSPKALFAETMERMPCPVKRRIYVAKSKIDKPLPLSGHSALSEYTQLNPPAVTCLAAGSISAWEHEATARLRSSEDQYEIELWRYDPGKLTAGGCVDKLSLALALRGEGDERVEEAVEDMLEQVWRDIDGQGDRKL